MTNLISSPNFEDVESLYGIYIQIPGNEESTIDSFYEFLSQGSVDRQLFLDAYCEYEFIEIEDTIVLNVQIKI